MPIVAAGASIGAFNALAAQCRYPWLFRTSICMSGSYRLQRFLGGEYSPELYLSSPLDYLPVLDGPVLDRLRHGFVLLASGEGAWEDIGESLGRWRIRSAQQGNTQPRRLVGPGLGTRLGHLAGHAPGLSARVHLRSLTPTQGRSSPDRASAAHPHRA